MKFNETIGIFESALSEKECKDAIKYFNKAYKINYNIKALFKIGKSYQKLGDTKNAIKYFRNVLKIFLVYQFHR